MTSQIAKICDTTKALNNVSSHDDIITGHLIKGRPIPEEVRHHVRYRPLHKVTGGKDQYNLLRRNKRHKMAFAFELS